MIYRLVVAGSRGITLYKDVWQGIVDSKFWHLHRGNLVIVSGMAPGVDRLGIDFAKRNGLKWDEMPADWNNLAAPGCIVKYNRWGKPYNANAGFARNIEMGQSSQGLCAIWDGHSPGTKQMIDWSYENGKDVYVHIVGRKK
jgi:hypothetical protein